MRQIVKSLFIIGFSVLGLFSFAANAQKTFLETISEQKTVVETMFDDTYSSVYKSFQSSVSGFLSSLDYQGLVCLGVIDDSALLKQIQEDSKNIKIGFLNAYANLYADAYDVEQKQKIFKDTSVSLFSDGVTYESEKERIMNNLSGLVQNQKFLFSQFKSSYQNKINQFIKDFYDYSIKNKTLLENVSTNIKTINLVEKNYNDLTSDLLKYQSKLAGSGSLFFTKLYLLKQSSMSGLDNTFQSMIDKEVKRYKMLPELGVNLNEQKKYALGLFDLQFDEKVNLLLNKRYDNKEFTHITQQVKQFKSSYKPYGRLVCSSFMSSTGFVSESSNILSKIKIFRDNFVSQVTGSVDSYKFQDAVNNRLPVIIQSQKDITKIFSTAISQQKQYLIASYKGQKITVSSGSELLNNIDGDISSSLSVSDSFKFTKAFKKNQYSNDIKILQQLLSKLGYYNSVIDGIYGPKTIEAVYKYQLDKGLLIGYEKKTQTWGRMGPSTRDMLNKDLLK